MKIFNVENGIKKVYVQMNDIAMLIHSDLPVPASIYEKIYADTVITDDSNRMDFVEFNQPSDIKFFESLDWIVDYKAIRVLSEEEINYKEQEIAKEINEIVNIYNSMSEEEKINNQSLVQDYDFLNYKLVYLNEILLVKKGQSFMPFPVVPDSDGFSLSSDGEFQYEIRESLDPNKIVLFRKDDEILSRSEQIPLAFYQMGISLMAMEQSKRNILATDFETSNYLTDDNKYFVIQCTFNNTNKVEEELVQEENVQSEDNKQQEEKGIKKLLRRIFGK